MFGYVNVYKDELKIKDYNTYRAYYCGLCKALGKKHSQISRLTLSYDFTFLLLLLDSVKDTPTVMSNEGCIKRIGKRKTVKEANGLEFSADMNLIFTYLKLRDDLFDNKSPKAFFSMLPFYVRARKLSKKYPELCEKTKLHLKRLTFLEKTSCDEIDKVAHEFAVILEVMFGTLDQSLSALGYILGRLIYIMDACDDLSSDYKKGSYNPLIYQYGYGKTDTVKIKEQITTLIYMSLSALAEEYQKLDIKKNKPLLDNIIYLGLRARCDLIINERIL